MASLPRHQTDKAGVFYILSTQGAKIKAPEGKSPAEKSDKIYYIMYRLDGKKVEEKVGRESERMTPAKAVKIREQRIHGVTLPNVERHRIRKEKEKAESDRWTVGRLWEAYKENSPNLKGIVTDENRFKNYLQDFVKLTPEELTTHMVDSLRLRLLKSGKKAGTTKNVLELLRRVVNFGVKKGHCAWQSPSRLHFEMPKLNNTKTEMLTQEERTRFLEAIQTAPNRKAAQLMLMAYYTGMRRNELFGLKWRHVDFENGFINIVGEKQEGAKSSRDERIPLSQPVRDLLREIEQGDSPYVFPGKNGVSRLTDINKQANAIKQAANLPKDFRPLHGLRHTFASVAVSNGVPLSHVQKLLTHKDPALTQRYAHLEDSALKNAANAVGEFLNSSSPSEKNTG